ncbi:Schizosaccharomyces specific protein [Schizosaccharomyces osmophilus]|uniref:Schizosaccharomyces specific protein n=1 Tax=Schizosaccharomyces osmophilus TaxID=2545709 RepID=A0AAF0AUR1_9SCHI|nr:Schizosaccharomyces specific protein [Schizosaccharomyces osmophilus]WBW71150.1 Schizosaccharomyces specific protein [Schizosaccharomyces osmophilus]
MEPYILPFTTLDNGKSAKVEYPFFIHSCSISLLITSMISCIDRNDAQYGLLICPEKDLTSIEETIIKNEGVFDTLFLNSSNSIGYLQFLDKIEILPLQNTKSLSNVINEAANQKGKNVIGITNISSMLNTESTLNAASFSSTLADVIEKCSPLIINETEVLETPIPISNSMKHENVTLENVYSLWIPVYLKVSIDAENPSISRASFHSREFSQTSEWKSNTFFQDLKINLHESYNDT